jgi:hypothetical protein
MDPESGTASVENEADYYKWDSPSGDFSVLLRLGLVDGMLSEVMSAFGALPKRGAETGGILLGRVEASGPATIVRVEAFEAVPCSYRHGPSYLLSESDMAAFEAAMRKCCGNGDANSAVGYYRSHTRNGESLGDGDRMLLARHFPPPNAVMLVIQPRASRPTTAGFLPYQNGQLADWPAAQFPFSRRELDGDRSAPRTPRAEVMRTAAPAAGTRLHRRSSHAPPPHEFSFAGYVAAGNKEVRPVARPARRRSVWGPILAGLFCVLLGVGAGIAGRPLIPSLNPPSHDPFVISLSARRVKDKLLISWDRDAPAVRYAQRGTLEITDGQFTKTIELTANELQTGSVIFHNSSEHVSLRMEILVHELARVGEVVRWDYEPPR